MRILVVAPNQNDATSFYRSYGPLTAMAKQRPEIKIIQGGDRIEHYGWATLRQADVLFLQRPANPLHLQIARHAKEVGIPIWVDYDDNLLNVPKHNSSYALFSSKESQDTIKECLEISDLATFSTDDLMETLGDWCMNTVLIKNAFDDTFYLSRRRERTAAQKRKIVVWRGTNTHERDLRLHADSIVQLSEKHPSWVWCFLGYDPWFITERLPGRVHTASWSNTPAYLDALNDLDYMLQIVPLSDSPFNRAKSDIAFLEASWAGAATIAPEWWGDINNSNGYTYKASGENFVDIVDAAMNTPTETLHEASNAAWEHVSRCRRLSLENGRRLTALKAITGLP